MPEEYDVLVKNGLIVDGTGTPAYKGSVSVKGERIVALGEVKEDAKTIIDAQGMAVTPGFIDVHNHGDMTIMYFPKADGFVRQGITTFVGGNCGSSPGPFGEYVSLGMMASDIIQELAPDMYYPSGTFRREQVNPSHRELFGWEIDWYTLGEFFKKLEAKGISPNYAPLLGHHPIRILAMGLDHKRKATPAEVEEMKKHVRQAMLDGCIGMSVGRDYDSYYADSDELVALAKVVVEYGGLYASHSLRTGLRRARRPGEPAPIKINGLLEAIDVGRKAKIPVQVSHLGALYDIIPMNNAELNEASAKATLKVVDDARKEGIDVAFDVIPGIRGFGTSTNIWLVSTLLPWLRVAGSREQLAKALRMKEFRIEIKDRIWEGKYYGLNPNISPNWAQGVNIMETKDGRFQNKNIAQIARELGVDPLDALMDVIVADPDAKVGSLGRESPMRGLFYQHPACMIGVDTRAVDTTAVSKTLPWTLPSENSFNGFAQYFQTAVREGKMLTLEEAVRKATSLPAAKFKLRDRGLLKPGAYADVVIFDPTTIANKATPLNPCVYPEGIPYVLVNGELVVKENQHTGVTPGKVLRRQ